MEPIRSEGRGIGHEKMGVVIFRFRPFERARSFAAAGLFYFKALTQIAVVTAFGASVIDETVPLSRDAAPCIGSHYPLIWRRAPLEPQCCPSLG